MPSKFVELEGELYWTRLKDPELSPFKNKPTDPDKYQWKTMLRPTQESLLKVMDMQSMGVKNKLGKDEKGYTVNFNRPTEQRNKRGEIVKRFDPPKVTLADGSVFEGLIGNGTKGVVTVELYEHGGPNNTKAHAARLHSVVIKELVEYKSPNSSAESY